MGERISLWTTVEGNDLLLSAQLGTVLLDTKVSDDE